MNGGKKAIQLTEKQIKTGWQVVKFGQITKEIRATTKTPIEDGLEFYVGLEHLDPQSLRIQRKGLIAEDNPSFNKRFSPGHILFGRRRAYLKKAAVADFEGTCSGDITVIEALPGLIIPKLLPFIVQSDMFFDWAVKNSAGGLSPRVKWKSLAEFEFSLPSVERQGEILEVLEKVEKNIGQLNNLIVSGNQLLKSIVIDQFKSNYEKIYLSDFCSEQRELIQPPFDKSINYVGFEHIDSVSIYLTSHGDIVSVVSAKTKFKEGNILYGKIRPYLRKAAIAAGDGLCSSDLIVLDVKPDISPVVIATILTSSYFSQIAMNSAKGTKMPRADWSVLQKTKIPKLFKDKSRDFSIVFDSIFKNRKIFENKIKQLSRIRNHIISGELF